MLIAPSYHFPYCGIQTPLAGVSSASVGPGAVADTMGESSTLFICPNLIPLYKHNATCGFDRLARYRCRASCCLPSAPGFRNALSTKAQRSSVKSAQLSSFLFLLVWNLAACNSRRLSSLNCWHRAFTRLLNDP